MYSDIGNSKQLHTMDMLKIHYFNFKFKYKNDTKIKGYIREHTRKNHIKLLGKILSIYYNKVLKGATACDKVGLYSCIGLLVTCPV